MKRIVSLTLVLAFALLLVGCNLGGNRVELSRGTIEGDVYSSEYLNLKFTKPASWVYSTDEEIAAMLNLGADFAGEKFKDALENNPSVYDMMVVDSLTGTNICIGYENLSKKFASNMTVEQYIEALEQNFKSISGINATFPDTYDDVTLGGNEYTRVITTMSMSGNSFKQVYYLYKVDGYMAFIIVTLRGNYTVAQIEGMFS